MFELSTTNIPGENKPHVKRKTKNGQKQTTLNKSADEPINVSIDDQLERFADILLDLYLIHQHEANQTN